MGNNLLLSSCIGGDILSYIEQKKRASYRAVITNTRPIEMGDVQVGFVVFYADYYNMLDFPKVIQALNAVIDTNEYIDFGKKKVEFFIMTV